MALRIRKKFHRYWLGSWFAGLLLLWFIPPTFYYFIFHDTSLWTDFHKTCIEDPEKSESLCDQLADISVASLQLSDEQATTCRGITSENHGQVDCILSYGRANERVNGNDTKYSLLAICGFIIFVPYWLIPLINKIDNLVPEDDSVADKIRAAFKDKP